MDIAKDEITLAIVADGQKGDPGVPGSPGAPGEKGEMSPEQIAQLNKASQDASAAVSTANSASSTANSAVSTANSASSKADSAVSTANTANTNAENALEVAQSAQTGVNNIIRRINITEDAVQIMENEDVVAEFKARSLALGKNFSAQEIGNSYLWSGVEMLDFLAGFFQLGAITIGDPHNAISTVPIMGSFPAISLTANHPTKTGKAYMQYDAKTHEFIGDVVVNGAIYATKGDTLIERGTSGIWTYEKWASGHCELYGTITKSLALTAKSANIFSTSSDQTELLPFAFASGVAIGNAVDKYSEAVTCHIDGQNLIWRPFRHETSSSTSRTYSFIIKGKLMLDNTVS